MWIWGVLGKDLEVIMSLMWLLLKKSAQTQAWWLEMHPNMPIGALYMLKKNGRKHMYGSAQQSNLFEKAYMTHATEGLPGWNRPGIIEPSGSEMTTKPSVYVATNVMKSATSCMALTRYSYSETAVHRIKDPQTMSLKLRSFYLQRVVLLQISDLQCSQQWV